MELESPHNGDETSNREDWAARSYRVAQNTFWANVITSFLLFVYTTAAIVLAYWSWQATEAASKSADAANVSADASIATVRAWIGTEDSKFVYIDPAGKIFSPMFDVTLNNLGKTPAQRLEFSAEFLFDERGGGKDKEFSGCPSANKSTTPFLIAEQKMPWTVGIGDIPKEDFAKLGSGTNKSLYVHGCISYDDVVSSRRRITEFCLRYFGPMLFYYCEDNNRME